jgi:hypothetical protein
MISEAVHVLTLLGEGFLPVLVVIILLALVVVLPRMARRKTTRDGEASPGRAVSSTLRAKEQMEDLIVKLHDFSREIQARLDNKISVLNRLIEEADEKIRELEARGISATPKAKAPDRSTKSKSDKPASEPGDVAKTPSRPKTGKYKSVYDLADEGHDAVSIARQTGLQPGEIELLLELRKTRRTGDKDKQ